MAGKFKKRVEKEVSLPPSPLDQVTSPQLSTHWQGGEVTILTQLLAIEVRVVLSVREVTRLCSNVCCTILLH